MVALNLLFSALLTGANFTGATGLLKKLAVLLIGMIEELVEETENKFDDYLIPVLEVLKVTLNIGNPKYLSGSLKDVFGVLMQVNDKLDGDDWIKKMADKVLDYVEEYVVGTKSRIDDALILPLCKLVRGAFDIPEFEEEVKPDPPVVDTEGRPVETIADKVVDGVVDAVVDKAKDLLDDII